MLKIQVLGNGFIPRGLGIAPRREPFKADLLLIQTILASPAKFTVNMFHPETGKIIEVTNKNVMSLWEKYSNYKSQQPPVVPGDKEDFKEDEFEEDKSEDESENESEDKNEDKEDNSEIIDKEDSLSVQMPVDEEEKVEATSNVSLHDEVEIKVTHEETSTPIQPNVNETVNVHNGNNGNNNYQNKSQKSQKNKKH